MKVLITGGLGTVGSLISDLFESDIYDSRNGDDIWDTSNLAGRMKGKDAVIHLAAYHGPFMAVPEDKYWKLNFEGTKQVVECMKKAGVKKLIFFSSNAVYGFSNGKIKIQYLPIDEKHPLPPDEDLEVYDRTKIACEKYLMGEKGVQAVIFRLAHPAWDKRCPLPASHLFAGVTHENLRKFVKLAMEYEGKSDIFNVGDPEIATQYCPDSIAFAKETYPEVESKLKKPTDPLYSIRKAKRILGFK